MAKENLKEDNEEALQMKSPGSHHLCSRAGQQQDNGLPPTSDFSCPCPPLPTRTEGTGGALANLLLACVVAGWQETEPG